MKQRTLNNQDGIALGPILFIIAILAILAAAIAAGSGAFNANTNTEGAKAYAYIFINFADQVMQGVQKVTSEGCDDTQVSFQNGVTNYNYTNSNAPANHSCHVFDPRGGAVTYSQMPVAAFAPCCRTETGSSDYLQTVFTGHSVINAGTGAPALIMAIGGLRQDVCIQINNRLGVTNPSGVPPNSTGTCFAHQYIGYLFTGTYVNDGTTWCGAGGSPQPTEACVYDTEGTYFFFSALKIR